MNADATRSPSPLPLTLVMVRNGFQVDPNQPLGRQSAGASFLEAYLHYSGNSTHSLVVPHQADGEWFHGAARAVQADARTEAVGLNRWGDAASSTGAIHVPDPGINHWAWKRMPWGDGAYSIIGIVHTLCSYSVQNALGQYSSAPVRPWDALICTSQAARQVVEGFLNRQEDWLRRRNEACRFERPQLPVIPLGIHPEGWAPPVSKADACREARARLGIRPEAQVVLLAGRLDLLTKFQPAPLIHSLAELQQTQHPDLELLVYGEAPSAEMLELWKKATRQLAPSLTVHWVPGRAMELARPVRWAADVFVSLSDNPQETFGITPLEAMAAELPCLVSDWDGYRESVVQPGEAGAATGLRVTTRLVAGLGAAEAQQMLHETADYSQAIGRVAQGIAVDLEQFKQHLSTLLQAPDLRAAMGAAGRRRVETHYNWRSVIEQWRALVADLTARRQQAIAAGLPTPPQLPPWMPDTSTGFGCFASEVLPASWSPSPPASGLEQQRLSNRFQSWDKDLLRRIDARRRGWWLKQGLIKP
ncbi:glycosyltransferase family 4 protein [Synechococcus sp. A15-28]|uniref:glycosyltransferase family 4 protein n=1 Tax=Synechococcus sp. A15-28 TaxID=1050638 RepID=UPI0016488D30|nr:glycosyltransferase family 4 protein [Synechococcus sp. A15-28]QNI41157.1 glycosyl transferases group 1 family protein [Synechococcus sp. A15-28]